MFQNYFFEEQNRFMTVALDEAREALKENEVPVGAVIVLDNQIIVKTHNKNRSLNNPLFHAEILAIQKASEILSTRYLEKCELYVTMEPCTMCAGAVLLSRIPCLYFGTFDKKFGACGSKINVFKENLFPHKIKIFEGILEFECKEIVKDFFQLIRKKS